MFEADFNGEIISSDSSWRVIKNPAYVRPDSSDIPANFRLSESNIYFDASRDIGKWYSVGYDISLWNYADIICNADEGAFGALTKRIIPQFKNYGLKDYENSADFENFTTTEKTTLKMKLPYNAQVTTYLEVSADSGRSKLRIRLLTSYGFLTIFAYIIISISFIIHHSSKHQTCEIFFIIA